MSDWVFLNKHRVRGGQFQSDDSFGFNGMFHFQLPDRNGPVLVRCLASDGGGWRHVSVSFPGHPTRTPSWEIMCKVKDLFWEEDRAVIQIHPKKADYVNHHKGCLHLWECLEAEQPLPPSNYVGPKEGA